MFLLLIFELHVSVRSFPISISQTPIWYSLTACLSWESVQGYSKRSIHFQKFILKVLLNIWRRAIYRLKGRLSRLFSHLTSTRYEPYVWRGRCNPAFPTLVPVIDRLSDWRILSITYPKTRCTFDTDVVLANSSTPKAFSCAFAAILNTTPLGRQNYRVRTWHLAGDSNQNFESFPFHPYTGHGFITMY
jgi:hypothetical protein